MTMRKLEFEDACQFGAGYIPNPTARLLVCLRLR